MEVCGHRSCWTVGGPVSRDRVHAVWRAWVPLTRERRQVRAQCYQAQTEPAFVQHSPAEAGKTELLIPISAEW